MVLSTHFPHLPTISPYPLHFAENEGPEDKRQEKVIQTFRTDNMIETFWPLSVGITHKHGEASHCSVNFSQIWWLSKWRREFSQSERKNRCREYQELFLLVLHKYKWGTQYLKMKPFKRRALFYTHRVSDSPCKTHSHEKSCAWSWEYEKQPWASFSMCCRKDAIGTDAESWHIWVNTFSLSIALWNPNLNQQQKAEGNTAYKSFSLHRGLQFSRWFHSVNPHLLDSLL